MAEDFLDDPDVIAEVRDAIQSVLSNTFGKHPFTVHTKVSVPGLGGGSPIETPTDVPLLGLVTDAKRIIDDDQNAPVELDSDAVLVLSTDYLDGEGRLPLFGGASGESEYDRQMEITLDNHKHRIMRIGRSAQFKEDYLVLFVSLRRTP